MKKTILILLSTVFCFTVFSQDRLNKVSMNPVSLIAKGVNNFEYERGFAEGKFGIAFYYGKTGNAVREVNGYKVSSSEQAISFNVYLRNNGPTAFWFGPRLSFTSSDIDDVNNPANKARGLGSLGIGLGLGYQLVLGGFYITPFINLGVAVTDDLWGTAAYYGNLEPNVFQYNFGLKTGIAF